MHAWHVPYRLPLVTDAYRATPQHTSKHQTAHGKRKSGWQTGPENIQNVRLGMTI